MENSRENSVISNYLEAKVKETEQKIKEKQLNFIRLEAQRNEMNRDVIRVKEELKNLLRPSQVIADIVKVMNKESVLVKTSSDGKLIVKVGDEVKLEDLKPGTRVTLKSEEKLKINRILPKKVDPLISLMKVEKVPDSSYDMVGGLEQQVKEVREVIELPIKHPEIFESLGIAQPKGCILYGPPGTGKTLVARAVAHHTDCTFIRVSGNELVQKYIGEGARMVRELFVMARQHAPSIIFMDEIDSIGGQRIDDDSKGDSEVQRTMLELLNQLDGFEASQNIKIVMATNRLDILDDALLRPGRIDRKIEFPHPNEKARYEIIRIHSKKMNLVRDINLKLIAEKMTNCSGAECKAVCTEAGMFALRERRMHITHDDFEMAVAKVMKKGNDSLSFKMNFWK